MTGIEAVTDAPTVRTLGDQPSFLHPSTVVRDIQIPHHPVRRWTFPVFPEIVTTHRKKGMDGCRDGLQFRHTLQLLFLLLFHLHLLLLRRCVQTASLAPFPLLLLLLFLLLLEFQKLPLFPSQFPLSSCSSSSSQLLLLPRLLLLSGRGRSCFGVLLCQLFQLSVLVTPDMPCLTTDVTMDGLEFFLLLIHLLLLLLLLLLPALCPSAFREVMLLGTTQQTPDEAQDRSTGSAGPLLMPRLQAIPTLFIGAGRHGVIPLTTETADLHGFIDTV